MRFLVVVYLLKMPKSHYMQAQGEALIRKALSELKLWGLQRVFSFVTNSSTKQGKEGPTAQGKSLPLVKEWSQLLSEVGDHQSLVASLKTSRYYHMFKV